MGSEMCIRDSSYIVHAERKDLKPLVTEYEGESMKDYPGEDFVQLGGIE